VSLLVVQRISSNNAATGMEIGAQEKEKKVVVAWSNIWGESAINYK
jgi:hypothetical protein